MPNVRVPSVGSIETVRVRDTGGTAIGVVLFASGRAWARDDRHGMTSWHDSLKKAVAEVRRRTRCATRLEADAQRLMLAIAAIEEVPGPRFCACGRVESDCDQSRASCPKAGLPVTPQEVFDRAVNGVIAQGRPSARILPDGKLRCLYRSPDGCKCAAGQVLTCEEDLLAADADPDGWYSKDLDVMAKEAGIDSDLLYMLQHAHDNAARWSRKDDGFDNGEFLVDFRIRANDVAKANGLRGVK